VRLGTAQHASARADPLLGARLTAAAVSVS